MGTGMKPVPRGRWDPRGIRSQTGYQGHPGMACGESTAGQRGVPASWTSEGGFDGRRARQPETRTTDGSGRWRVSTRCRFRSNVLDDRGRLGRSSDVFSIVLPPGDVALRLGAVVAGTGPRTVWLAVPTGEIT